MLSDIEIAQSAKLKRIDDLAHEWGLEFHYIHFVNHSLK